MRVLVALELPARDVRLRDTNKVGAGNHQPDRRRVKAQPAAMPDRYLGGLKLSLEEGELQGGWFVVTYRNENARRALVV